jgi:hypothetical protein
VIVHGQTGFLCQNVEDCIAAIAPAAELDRRTCRDRVLTHFTAKRMVDGYEAVYQKILLEQHAQNGRAKALVLG